MLRRLITRFASGGRGGGAMGGPRPGGTRPGGPAPRGGGSSKDAAIGRGVRTALRRFTR